LSAVFVKENSSTRANRFENQTCGNARRKNDELRAKREAKALERERLQKLNKPKNLIQADY
jgi:hypothetical protein